MAFIKVISSLKIESFAVFKKCFSEVFFDSLLLKTKIQKQIVDSSKFKIYKLYFFILLSTDAWISYDYGKCRLKNYRNCTSSYKMLIRRAADFPSDTRSSLLKLWSWLTHYIRFQAFQFQRTMSFPNLWWTNWHRKSSQKN